MLSVWWDTEPPKKKGRSSLCVCVYVCIGGRPGVMLESPRCTGFLHAQHLALHVTIWVYELSSWGGLLNLGVLIHCHKVWIWTKIGKWNYQ